jgi:oxygen-independent coproporphyrinogen III oxidase
LSLSLPEWLRFVETHPHDFTIQYPVRREYFLHNFRRTPAPRARDWFEDAPEALLYLHVPFCEAKCFYCNFAVDVSADEQVHTGYVDALLRELETHAGWLSRTKIRGIDIGGGTPTRLTAKQLARLCQAVAPYAQDSNHAFPVSIETTPRIASQEPEKLNVLRRGGVQRVSMGVQSFNAATLALVNRRRQVEQTEQAMMNLRAAGFNRLNLDIIFGLPGQTMQDWLADLDQVLALAPDSLTTYDCLYRGKGRALTKIAPSTPSPSVYGAMYDVGHAKLTAAGWHAPYGSVNFSRRADETGTSACFEGRLLDGLPYLGVGNYASSLRGNHWSFNAYSVGDYVSRIKADANPCEYYYELPQVEAQAKYLLYSLNYGFIDEDRFLRRFGLSLAEAYPQELAHALSAGLMQKIGPRRQVMPARFDRMHVIRSLFYPAAAKDWLMSLRSVDRIQPK